MPGPNPNRVRTDDIKSRISWNAQTSVYQVKLQPPPLVLQWLRNPLRAYNYQGPEGIEVELACESAALPGSSLATHQQSNDYHGVTEKMAYRRMYDATTDFTFYVNRYYDVIELFDGWMDYITGVEIENGDFPEKTREVDFRGSFEHHRMNFPLNYKTNIHISKFEKNEQRYLFAPDDRDVLLVDDRERLNRYKEVGTWLEYTFIDAFPLNVIASPVSYGPSDLLRYTVSMAYTRYTRQRRDYNRRY